MPCGGRSQVVSVRHNVDVRTSRDKLDTVSVTDLSAYLPSDDEVPQVGDCVSNRRCSEFLGEVLCRERLPASGATSSMPP